MMQRFIRASVFAACLVSASALAQDSPFPEAATGRSAAKGGEGYSYMVVAANPLAADVGARIIKAGGTAADAAIAVQLVLTLVEPQSSGIGGGAFALYWNNAKQEIASYDGRETAPAAAAENRFLTADGKPMSRRAAIVGGKSVGVPGVVRMLELLHKQHGKLSWAKNFQPAIELAEKGFAVSPRLYQLLAGESALRENEAAKAFYYEANGNPKPVGTILKNPKLAAVLREIAAKGADAFYTGRIAADIVKAVDGAAGNPADMTLDDLKNYRAVQRPAVCGLYRQHKVCSMGPPSSGAVGILQSLGVIERFDLRGLGPQSAGAEHLLIEAGRLALADRAVYLADPDKVNVPTDALTSPDYLKQRSGLISLDARIPKAEAGKVPVKGAELVGAPSPELPSTSHFSIVDKAGNAIAMTSSVEAAFGSRLMVDGFILNNQLTDFSYEDVAESRTVANRVEGGKRPRSSMSPTLVFAPDGKLEIVVGSPLGAAIVSLVVKTLVGMIDWQMTPEAVAAMPGALIFGNNGVLIEDGLEPIKSDLERLGHQVRVGEYASGIHAIRITKNGLLLGGADPRREGVVVGE